MPSPENYIRTKGRTLPIHDCLVNQDWRSNGLANIMVVRRHPAGNFTVGMYLVDLLCLGVKDTHFLFNLVEEEYNRLVAESKSMAGFINVSYTLVHNIIYSALQFAEDYGLKPHKDFALTKYLIEEDTDKIKLMDIECGKDGKPMLVLNPDNKAKDSKAIPILEKTAGPGNYYVVEGFADFESSEIHDDTDEFEDDTDEFDVMRARAVELIGKKNRKSKEETELAMLCISLFNEYLDEDILDLRTEMLRKDLDKIVIDENYLDGLMGCEGLILSDARKINEDVKEIRRLLHSEKKIKSASKVLDRLKQQYADIPAVLVAESVVLDEADDKNAPAFFADILQRFPDYSMARIQKAIKNIDYELDKPNTDDLPDYMSFSGIFGKRTVVHPRELFEYLLLRIQFAVSKGDLEEVEAIDRNISKLDALSHMSGNLELSLIAYKIMIMNKLLIKEDTSD